MALIARLACYLNCRSLLQTPPSCQSYRFHAALQLSWSWICIRLMHSQVEYLHIYGKDRRIQLRIIANSARIKAITAQSPISMSLALICSVIICKVFLSKAACTYTAPITQSIHALFQPVNLL